MKELRWFYKVLLILWLIVLSPLLLIMALPMGFVMLFIAQSSLGGVGNSSHKSLEEIFPKK